MSRAFVSLIIGLGLTILSWYVAWLAWLSEPGLFVARTFFPGFSELESVQKATVLVFLIILNSSTWAAVVWIAAWAMKFRGAPAAGG